MSYDWNAPVSQNTYIFSVRTKVGRVEVAQVGDELYRVKALLEAQYGADNVIYVGQRTPGDVIGR